MCLKGMPVQLLNGFEPQFSLGCAECQGTCNEQQQAVNGLADDVADIGKKVVGVAVLTVFAIAAIKILW